MPKTTQNNEEINLLIVGGLDDGIELSNEESGVTCLKELIYCGDFVKDVGTPRELRFSVTPARLKHWFDTNAEMVRDGVKVPLPLEHTSDPEKNRAWLLGTKLGQDSKGRDCLFGVVKFPDAETAKLRHTTDVSIFVPPQSSNGAGKVYRTPIKHVAFTTYPVIPDLDGFKTIAASMVPSIEIPEPIAESEMPKLKSLADKLGLKLSADADADTIADAIAAAFDGNGKTSVITSNIEGAISLSSLPPGIVDNMKNLARKNRVNDIRELHLSRRINRATADKLVEAHCNDDAITLSLSSDGGDDSFDATIQALSLNTQQRQELTPSQIIALSDTRNGAAVNPLLADADRRAKSAQNN